MTKPKVDIFEAPPSRTEAQRRKDMSRIFNALKADISKVLATIREDREDGTSVLFVVPMDRAVQIGTWSYEGETLPRYGLLFQR